jgi:hypothetical protein
MSGAESGRARLRRRGPSVAAVVASALVLAACSSGSKATSTSTTTSSAPTTSESTGTTVATVGGVTGKPGYLVYWDQNEEVDFLSMPTGTQGQAMPAWDLNGQVCVLPDGRFVGGVDPTLPGQRNLGSAKPYKQPADGEELNLPNGSFSGRVLYVPGPYKMPGQSVGQDSPPTADGVFNNNSTYTGCAIDKAGNVLGSDIATAQGTYPPPSSGRLVEWFAPSYTTYCIVYGPTTGGFGPHHADGTGGLAQPGMMTLADNGDVLVPNVGTQSVLRFARSSLPATAADCPGGVYPRSKVQVSAFVKDVPFPAGVAKDPTCDCFGLTTYIGSPAIRWVTKDGRPEPGRGTLPGTSVADVGKSASQFNPFGLAFAPDGTLYFVDIHIACRALLTGCGPASYGGRVMKVTVTNGQPSAPVVVAGGFDFPTSVTVCVPAATVCPYPSGAIVAPLSGPAENPAPAKGPASNAPATAGFG